MHAASIIRFCARHPPTLLPTAAPHLPPLVKLLAILDTVLLAQHAAKGPDAGKHKGQLEQAVLALGGQVLGAQQALGSRGIAGDGLEGMVQSTAEAAGAVHVPAIPFGGI